MNEILTFEGNCSKLSSLIASSTLYDGRLLEDPVTAMTGIDVDGGVTRTLLGAAATSLLALWLLAELLFWVVYKHVLLPRFQKLRPLDDYRIGRDRRRLFVRIAERLEATCRANNKPVIPEIESYIRDWFYSPGAVHPRHVGSAVWNRQQSTLAGNIGRTTMTETPSYPPNEAAPRNVDDSNLNGVPHDFRPLRGDMDEFFAWAFFALPHSQLDGWMLKELETIYTTLSTRYGLTFKPGTSSPYIRPMRLTLDPLQSSHRPLFIYLAFAMLKVAGGLVLRMTGFSVHRTTSGLRYWYRPRRGNSQWLSTAAGAAPATDSNPARATADDVLPLLFLHGIAPGGITPYLPMLFFLGRDGRPLLFFENPGISFGIHQSLLETPPTESETTSGIWEAVHRHLGSDAQVSVVGHSFGSCPITWLIHSPYAHKIRQIVLVDPVSILLSHPDVITNFLYARTAMKKRSKHAKIGVVSNELFTEYYLRRHFAWYNSELWLEDLPSSGQCKVLVCLSTRDEVLPFEKVKREIDRVASTLSTSSTTQQSHFDVLVWEGAKHAHCVTRPRTWRQMRSVMRRQERLILQGLKSPATTETIVSRAAQQPTKVVAVIGSRKTD